ncbi:MAG: hypothetical protein H0T89_06435 [Deltaproteobacteria bacterium]|nr:hypothetical protein [Deltaproteobacteria bacterium]
MTDDLRDGAIQREDEAGEETRGEEAGEETCDEKVRKAAREDPPPKKSASQPAKKPAAKVPPTKKPPAKKSPAKKPPAKKSAAKQPAAKQPAAKPPRKQPAGKQPSARTKPQPPQLPARLRATDPPTYAVPTGRARQRLRDALAWVEDFVVEMQRLATEPGALPWPHADSLELVGLERWGTQLAKTDREAGVCALVLAAQHGFPRVLAAGGSGIEQVGMRGREGDPIVDGAPVDVQLGRAARWVDDPAREACEAAQEAFDPTRQLNVWDDDLRPPDASAFWWYLEVGQCACAAIFRERGEPGRQHL